MIRKFLWILIALFGYVYFVATEGEGVVFTKAKTMYQKCLKDIKKMKIKVKVNKLSSKK